MQTLARACMKGTTGRKTLPKSRKVKTNLKYTHAGK